MNCDCVYIAYHTSSYIIIHHTLSSSGCNGRIPNLPTTPLENLINVRKDVQHCRHKATVQLQCSSQPQNLHFHLSLRCVVAKYPMFLKSDLKIDQDMYSYLTSEHKMKLFSGFNVVA